MCAIYLENINLEWHSVTAQHRSNNNNRLDGKYTQLKKSSLLFTNREILEITCGSLKIFVALHTWQLLFYNTATTSWSGRVLTFKEPSAPQENNLPTSSISICETPLLILLNKELLVCSPAKEHNLTWTLRPHTWN